MMNASLFFLSGKFLREMYLVELPLTLSDTLGTLVEFPIAVRGYVSEIENVSVNTLRQWCT